MRGNQEDMNIIITFLMNRSVFNLNSDDNKEKNVEYILESLILLKYVMNSYVSIIKSY